MGDTYRIDLIDHQARKSTLGMVTDDCVQCTEDSDHPISVIGKLRHAPEDKEVYLKTASTHGDTMKLSISNENRTYLGDFRLRYFDPQSCKAEFRSVGDVKVIS